MFQKQAAASDIANLCHILFSKNMKESRMTNDTTIPDVFGSFARCIFVFLFNTTSSAFLLMMAYAAPILTPYYFFIK